MGIGLVAVIFTLACIAAAPASAGEAGADNGGVVSIRWENDVFGRTDEYYTNGGALALTLPGQGLIGGVWDIFGAREGKRFSSYDMGQLIFTPADIQRVVPDPADRPYAGFLYLGATTFLKKSESLHGLKLMLGVVGPASLGEAIQKSTHRAMQYRLPQGWGHQIKNEPIVNLHYEYRRRFSITRPDGGLGMELIPMGGATLGNFLTEGQAKLQFRIGYNMPDDFGTTDLRGIGFLPFFPDNPAQSWGVCLFAGAGASLVARNITLDGNTFTRSRSVDKRPVLPATELGASLWARNLQISFTYVMLGEEFYGQRRREDYGSVLLSYLFR